MKRKSAIVPRLVLTASFASVVPMCAIACSGPDPLLDQDTGFVGGDVAADAFGCCRRFDGVAEIGFSVADVGFANDAGDAQEEVGDSSPADSPPDAD